MTTDAQGHVTSQQRYYPYGEPRPGGQGSSPTDFGFTAQRNEASFGLMDYNARYYSPLLGRFVSPDSIVPEPSSSGGFNRYRYARNSPLKYIDPTGHQGCEPLPGIDCTVIDHDGGIQLTSSVIESPNSEAYNAWMIEQVEAMEQEGVEYIPLYQDEADLASRLGNLIAVPFALADQTTYIAHYSGNYYSLEYIDGVGHIKLMPSEFVDVNASTYLSKVSTAASGAVPVIVGTLNALEIDNIYGEGVINGRQAAGRHVGNVSVTSLTVSANTVVLPSAAALTNAPVTTVVVGGLALTYDMSVIQGMINYRLEGQSMYDSYINARRDTNASLGISYWLGE